MKNGSFIWLRVLGALLVLGLIAGAGAFGYKAGMAQGISQAPAVAKAIEKAAENGQPAPIPQMMYQRGFGYGYSPMPFHHGGFFNPIGAICGSIFFLFLFFGAMKMLFFRRMAWHGHMHGPWGWHGEGGFPPVFNEWHKRAHGEQPEGEKKEDESSK
jgi:hypothetical protein